MRSKYQEALDRRKFLNQLSERQLWHYIPKEIQKQDVKDAEEDYDILQAALDELEQVKTELASLKRKKKLCQQRIIRTIISLIGIALLTIIIGSDNTIVSETKTKPNKIDYIEQEPIIEITDFDYIDVSFPEKTVLTGDLLIDLTAKTNSTIINALDDMTHKKNGVWKYTTPGLKGKYHLGVDYVAEENANVYAPLSGIIIKADGHYKREGYIGNTDGQFICGGGNQVYLLAEYNEKVYCFIFMHLKNVDVGCGDIVGQGTVLGHVGSTGSSSSYHCHIETYYIGDGKISDYAYNEYENDFGLGRNAIGYNNRCEAKNAAPCIMDPEIFFNNKMDLGRS